MAILCLKQVKKEQQNNWHLFCYYLFPNLCWTVSLKPRYILKLNLCVPLFPSIYSLKQNLGWYSQTAINFNINNKQKNLMNLYEKSKSSQHLSHHQSLRIQHDKWMWASLSRYCKSLLVCCYKRFENCHIRGLSQENTKIAGKIF